jgi:hypothetical protein
MIEFLSKEKLLELIVNDPDKYYKTFFKLDLDVRNVDTISEYKEKIKESVCEFTKKQQYKIIKYILQIDQQLTMAYSKEENAIVERSNKEVMRHLRAIIFDKIVFILLFFKFFQAKYSNN